MKIDPLLLPALVTFECVARHASFSRAAEEMGLSASALSQSLRSLESRLGVRLLARTTRRVALTEEGARILEGVREGLASLGSALDVLEAQRSRPAGTVRVTLPRMTFTRFFAPHLAEFSRRHPEVNLEFALEDRLVDIVADGFDVGVRMGGQIAADMIAVPLGGPERLVTIGAPEYFRRHPPPATPEALDGHDCVLYRYASSGRIARWTFQRDGLPLEVDVSGRFTVNDLQAELELVRRGLVLAQTVGSIVAQELAEGSLVAVLDEYAVSLGVAHLYFPSRAQMPPRLRVFLDHFRRACSTAPPGGEIAVRSPQV
ncbi:MAG: LysR family transcriptional regulator [Rhodocyclaceae bacterium]